MSSDPQKTVIDFLNRNGYAFEMKVAKCLHNIGFGVSQSYFYRDPITENSREIDVVGLFQYLYKDIHFNVILIIECKYAKNPWILFTSKLGLGDNAKNYYSNKSGTKWINHAIMQSGFSQMFEIISKRGYGLTVTDSQIDDTPKNNAYKAIQSVLNLLKSEEKEPKFSYQKSYNLFIPIIAIKGKIFEAFLDENNNVETLEITEGQLYYKETIAEVIPKIHIVTEGSMENYFAKVYQDCQKIVSTPFINDELINNYPTLYSFG